MNIAIFYGSVRSARVGIRAVRYLQAQCEARGWQVDVVDPMERQLPLLDKMYKEYGPGEAPATLEWMAGVIKAADGFLVVSGEYNHSIPPALSNTMDHFLTEYRWRPSAIACYSAGSFGGVRAAVHLRAFLAELGTPSISPMLPFPRIQDMLDASGAPADAHAARLEQSAKRFLDAFAWHMEALQAQRAKGLPD